MNTIIHKRWSLPLCFFVLMATSACEKKQMQPQKMAVPVQAITVQPMTIPVNYTSIAQTEGSLEVEVRARVNGILDEFRFTEGDMVKKDQSLFIIDPRPFKAAVDEAKANVAASEAELKQAEQNLARIKPLFKENAVSQKDYDDAVAADNVARAKLGVEQAALRTAQLNLEYAYVYAPITGVVGKSIPSRGSLVTAQQTLLTRISKVHPMYINFSYSDTLFRKLADDKRAGRIKQEKAGALPVSIKLSDGSVYPHIGRINFQDIQINTQTGTIPTRAEIANPDIVLRPGQFVEVTVMGLIRPNAIVVPQRAVLEGEKGKFVFVVDQNNQAQLRWIEVGDWYLDQWIVNKGLSANERVITDGLVKVAPHSPVQVTLIPNTIGGKTTVALSEATETTAQPGSRKQASNAAQTIPAKRIENMVHDADAN